MALSPNAGKDKYLLEKHTGIIHYLKNETEECNILKVGPAYSSLTSSYEKAAEIVLLTYHTIPRACKYCCKE